MFDHAVTPLDLKDDPSSRHTCLKAVAWDARAREILYLSNEAGPTGLWSFDPGTGMRKALIDPELNVTRFWLVDLPGVRLVLACDHACTEREQLFLLLDDGSLRPWIEAANTYHYFGGQMYDGTCCFVENAASETRHRIMQADVSTGDIRELASSDAVFTELLALSPNRLLVLEERTNIDRRFCVFDVNSVAITPLAAGAGRIGRVRRLSGNTVIFSGDLGGEWIGIHKLTLDTEAVETVFERPGQDVQDFCLHPETGRMAITLGKACASEIVATTLDDVEDIQTLTRAPIHVQSMCFIGEDNLLTVTSNPFSPPAAQVHALAQQRETPAGPLGKPADRRDRVGRFTSFDGRDIEFVLMGRSDSHRAVIYLHGGPESKFERSHCPILEGLVERGIAVIAPNIRGSAGYGRSFIGLDDGKNRTDALGDVIALRQHLRTQYGLQDGQVGIMGHSYGGFMTLMAISHHPALWSFAVAIAGMSHLGNFLKTAPAWRRRLRAMEYGDAASHHEFFDHIAPLNRAGDIRCPLLILHGDSDTRVPVSESMSMAKALTAAGRPCKIQWIAEEGHFLTKRTSTEFAAGAINDFVNGSDQTKGETRDGRVHFQADQEAK